MAQKIPVSLKIIYSAFMMVLIPVYWRYYGPTNFLWISDVSLILAFLAVLFENKIFASMAAIGGLVLETFWMLSFALVLFFNIHFTDIADYMFDSSLPLWLRSISLFHIALPPLFIWLILRLGYVQKAVYIQITLTWVILGITWGITKPSENINWVFSYLKIEGLSSRPLLYLILEGLGIAGVLFLTHLLLRKVASQYGSLTKSRASKGVTNTNYQ